MQIAERALEPNRLLYFPTEFSLEFGKDVEVPYHAIVHSRCLVKKVQQYSEVKQKRVGRRLPEVCLIKTRPRLEERPVMAEVVKVKSKVWNSLLEFFGSERHEYSFATGRPSRQHP